MERALGCSVQLLSRSARRLCAMALHWEASVQMDALVIIREVRLLRESSRLFNGQMIMAKASSGCWHCFSDASEQLCRSAGIYGDSRKPTWSSEESTSGSTWRELEAAHRSLLAWQRELTGRALLRHCDNVAVVLNRDYGSNKLHLQ